MADRSPGAARIILVGATGYTGRLTAEALARDGAELVLVGRSEAKLAALADCLPARPSVAAVDLTRDESLDGVVETGDVLVSAAGPFVVWGDPAIRAAIRNGAHYLDCNAEPAFTRQVFESYGPDAERAGLPLLTAVGWESMPGNLAAAIALREAGDSATRVDVGYFYTSQTRFSPGSRASFAAAMVRPGFAFRDGAVRTVRGAERFRTMPAGRQARPAISIGAAEHFTLPRVRPSLREVNVYAGWFGGLPGSMARGLHLLSRPGFALLRVPGVRRLHEAATARYLSRVDGEPDAQDRARGSTHVAAIAYDSAGRAVATTHLSGAEGYDFTGAILAWAARRVAVGQLSGTGALGPIEAFGLDALEEGCRAAGISRPTSG